MNSITFVTDVLAGEPDILAAVKNQPLSLIDSDGELIRLIPAPAEGWSHEALHQTELNSTDAVDAYLGDQWVGSTEV